MYLNLYPCFQGYNRFVSLLFPLICPCKVIQYKLYFCPNCNCLGNTAPFYITQPLIDNDIQIVSSTETMVNLTCSMNVAIHVAVFWNLNNTINFSIRDIIQTVNSTTLLIRDLQPSDAGVYQCIFNDNYNIDSSGWILRRNIRLVITCMLYI